MSFDKPRNQRVRRESAKLYRASGLRDIELLYATYVSHTFARHAHETFAIGVVEDGVGAYDCENRRYVVRKGDIFLINPDDLHTGGAGDRSGVTYRMCYIPVARMRQVENECENKQPSLPIFPERAARHQTLGRLVRNLHLALGESISVLEQESRLLYTLAQLITTYCGTPIQIPAKKPCPRAVRQVRAVLEDRYADHITLLELSELTRISPYYLLRMFRNNIGLPPHAYQNQVRIAKAKALLARGRLLAHVAAETGFVDQSHFTKVFKRIVGVTPGQYASAFSPRERFTF